MFSNSRTKCAPANYDEIKRPKIASARQSGSGTGVWIYGNEHFVKGIAVVTSENIAVKAVL